MAATYILYVNLTLVLKNSKWRYGNHGDHGPNYNVKKLFSYCLLVERHVLTWLPLNTTKLFI